MSESESCPSCGHGWDLHTDFEGGCAGGPEPCWCRRFKDDGIDYQDPPPSPDRSSNQ